MDELYGEGVIRIYDVLFPATVLLETDAYVRDFLVRYHIPDWRGWEDEATFKTNFDALMRDLSKTDPAAASGD